MAGRVKARILAPTRPDPTASLPMQEVDGSKSGSATVDMEGMRDPPRPAEAFTSYTAHIVFKICWRTAPIYWNQILQDYSRLNEDLTNPVKGPPSMIINKSIGRYSEYIVRPRPRGARDSGS